MLAAALVALALDAASGVHRIGVQSAAAARASEEANNAYYSCLTAQFESLDHPGLRVQTGGFANPYPMSIGDFVTFAKLVPSTVAIEPPVAGMAVFLLADGTGPGSCDGRLLELATRGPDGTWTLHHGSAPLLAGPLPSEGPYRL